MLVKPGNKTVAPSWPDPYVQHDKDSNTTACARCHIHICSSTTIWHETHISQEFHELIIQISKKIYVVFACNIMMKSGYNFAHVMTAELSWHMPTGSLIIRINITEKGIFKRFKFYDLCEMDPWLALCTQRRTVDPGRVNVWLLR